MKLLAIEINNAGLVVADPEQVLCEEPGFALVDGKRILTGNEAFAQARLKPRNTSSRHWSALSVEPGSAAVPGNYSTAALAHAQLSRLWNEHGKGIDKLVFVVPSVFEPDSLGVLLGIAEECGIAVGAIVDCAVAASSKPWPGRQLVYLDADLGSVFLTPLEQGERVAAGTPVTLGSLGIGSIADAFARRIADSLVYATRFDPMHRADTEQRLYDSLEAALDALDRHGEATVSIEGDKESFEASVQRSELLGSVQGFYRAVLQLVSQSRQAESELVIQISDRLAGLPGFEEELSRLDAATFVPLKPGHAARGALACASELALDEPSVRLFRHLPWREEAADEVPGAAASVQETRAERAVANDEPRPTHVVYSGVAYPINGEGVLVGRSRLDQRRAILVESRVEGVSRAHCEIRYFDGELRLKDLSSFGTFVNERRIDSEYVLKAADVIRVGSPGAELTVVRVEEADGP